MSSQPKYNGHNPTMFDEGLKVRRAVVGDAYVDKALQGGASEFSWPGQQLVSSNSALLGIKNANGYKVTEYCWGEIWTRPGLDRKQRSLLSMIPNLSSQSHHYMSIANDGADLGMLIALKSWPELAIHTRGAINNGLTEVEIREAVLQATIYCGVPVGREAMQVCEKTINDMVEKGEHKRQLKSKA